MLFEKVRQRRNGQPPYGPVFYQNQLEGALRSAKVVVPLLITMIKPRSIVDVGCGLGAWLRVFREQGIERTVGLDGSYIDPVSLEIPSECFIPVDLAKPFQITEKFDLALCLEVAEHLPKSSADGFICALVKLAPVIVFSAGIPLQGGTHHTNEQWPEYWEERFRHHNYQMLDLIRGLVWKNSQVAWWYRQNMFIYVSEDVISNNPAFRDAMERTNDLMLIHQSVLERHVALRAILKTLPTRILGATYRRIERVLGSVLSTTHLP